MADTKRSQIVLQRAEELRKKGNKVRDRKEERENRGVPKDITEYTKPVVTEDTGATDKERIVRDIPSVAIPQREEFGGQAPDQELIEGRKKFAEGGIFDVPARPVKDAEPTPDVPWWKRAVAGAGAVLVPGVGGLASIPLQASIKKRNDRVGKDRQLTQQFFASLEEDPKLAKEYLRIGIYRDALQREYGMSGDEILDLDQSITKEGIMSRKDMVKTLINRGMAGTIDTDFGKFKTPSQAGTFKTDPSTGLTQNTTTGEFNLDVSRQRYNMLIDRAKKSGLDDLEAYYQASGQMNPNNKSKRMEMKILGNGESVYVFDNVLGVGRTFSTGHTKAASWKVEEAEDPQTGLPIGMILYNSNARDEKELGETSTFIDPRLVTRPDGRSMQDDIDDIQRQNEGVDNRSAIRKIISSWLGKLYTITNNSQGTSPPGVEQQGVNNQVVNKLSPAPINNVQPQIEKPSIETNPVKTQEEEVRKANNFFLGE